MAIEKQHIDILRELGQLDGRLKQLEIELAGIPLQLETSGADYLTLARTLQTKESRLETITKERQSLEIETKTLAEEMQEKEKRLYAIKTQQEYQATLKEIAKIKQENKTRENRVLSLLEEGEKIVAEITQLKSESADKEGEFRKVEGELTAKQTVLMQELAGLKERRPQIFESLPPEILKKYDAVKKRFGNPLAGVKKGVCQGCDMNIPPQIYNEMLRANDLRNCPNCHRLIYADL